MDKLVKERGTIRESLKEAYVRTVKPAIVPVGMVILIIFLFYMCSPQY